MNTEEKVRGKQRCEKLPKCATKHPNGAAKLRRRKMTRHLLRPHNTFVVAGCVLDNADRIKLIVTAIPVEGTTHCVRKITDFALAIFYIPGQT